MSDDPQPDGTAQELTAAERAANEIELIRSRSRLKIRACAEAIIKELDVSEGQVSTLLEQNHCSKLHANWP